MATPTWALITGPTSGIGEELAHIHAAQGGNLVLVGRREDALKTCQKTLSAKFGCTVHYIVCDLEKADAAQYVYEQTKALGVPIHLLINNAGFGDFGYFHEADTVRIQSMINLNVATLTALCRLFLPEMIQRKQGGILNVASTAAFQPGPGMGVYFATKAYVLSFTEALHEEVAQWGIRVSALCPGPTKTKFFNAANMEDARLTKMLPMPSAADVAALGYASVQQGKAVAIHGFMNKTLIFLIRFVPRSWVRKMTRSVIGLH